MSQTDAKASTRRISQSPELVQFAVAVAAEAMFTVAPDGSILDANETACERLEQELIPIQRESLLWVVSLTYIRTSDFNAKLIESIWSALITNNEYNQILILAEKLTVKGSAFRSTKFNVD